MAFHDADPGSSGFWYKYAETSFCDCLTVLAAVVFRLVAMPKVYIQGCGPLYPRNYWRGLPFSGCMESGERAQVHWCTGGKAIDHAHQPTILFQGLPGAA